MASHMARSSLHRRHVHHRRGAAPEAFPQPVPLPMAPDTVLAMPDLTRRDAASTSDNGPLPTSTSVPTAIPIAVGVV
jgi:hypothetical protein